MSGQTATVEALDRAEPLDPHLLAPRRRVLKRRATQKPRLTASRSWPNVRGDQHAQDELRDETEDDATAVQADNGDVIRDQRACPYVLSSLHLGRRHDHSSIHVLTRATDQDEVAAAGTSTRRTRSVTRQWSKRVGCWKVVICPRTRIV